MLTVLLRQQTLRERALTLRYELQCLSCYYQRNVTSTANNHNTLTSPHTRVTSYNGLRMHMQTGNLAVN
jgi:hypothetical protein